MRTHIIEALDFDVLCLQEVPDGFMKRLRSLPYNLADVVEYNYTLKDRVPRQTHSVVLSPHPIEGHEEIRIPNWFERPILRERIAVGLLRFFRIWRWTKSNGDRAHLLAWINLPGVGRTQVFSLHLTIHSPRARRVELSAIRDRYKQGGPALVCGDLNIFDTYRVALPAWLFGASFGDTLMPWRERAQTEKFIASLGLRNPLRGMCTHRLTGCQLDHILVSKHFSIEAAAVVNERYGSDHNPVFVELCA